MTLKTVQLFLLGIITMYRFGAHDPTLLFMFFSC